MSILGYVRDGGAVGTRNHVAILASVCCANGVVEAVTRTLPKLRPLTHTEGCGRGPQDLISTTRTLTGLGKNPNVYGAVVVGLGCEFLKAPMIGSEIKGAKPTDILVIQESGGSQRTIEKATEAARKLLDEASRLERREVPWGGLTVGLEFGGARGASAAAAHRALGPLVDRLIEAGARVVVPELGEMFDTAEELRALSESDAVVDRAMRALAEREKARVKILLGRELAARPRKAEGSLGLASLGAQSKVKDVLDACSPAPGPGLYLMDTPSVDAFAVSALVAGGAQLVVQTTEQGNPAGFPIAPVIKVSTRSETFEAMGDDIDIDAGRVATGADPAVVAREIAELVERVAAGAQTRAEENDMDVFALETFGPAF